MKEKLTELVFILDRSGSMSGLEADTVGGFNAMIKKQKRLEGEVIVSTVLFNNQAKVLHNRVNIDQIKEMNEDDYHVGGTTALLDTVGKSLRKIKHVYGDTLQEDRPSKVVFVITTDGMENSSSEFTYKMVSKRIKEMKEKYDWEFLFLGANIDSAKEAEKFGIEKDRAVRYHSDKLGTKVNFETVGNAISSIREHKSLNANWKKDIESDFQSR